MMPIFIKATMRTGFSFESACERMKRRLKEAYENYLIGKIDAAPMDQRLQSYLGSLSHANQYTLSMGIKNAYWVRTKK